MTSSGPSRRVFLSAAAAAAAAVSVPAGAGAALAASGKGGSAPGVLGRTTSPQTPSRELVQILDEVDPARIEAIVRRLAAFGTRHTLSSQSDPERGIGAARDWIFEQMKTYAAASGGRMTVELQSYDQPPVSRIPVTTTITNVVATLRGSSDPNRVYVVSGHYDSRATDVNDFTSDAPGADDDASGVAVAMELARIMATRMPEATIVFAAVAGEEQGLFGANNLAERMKASGVDLQAMFTNDIVGASRADDGTVDGGTVRLFAEGVPSSETAQEASTRQSVGGENDSPSRQLGRFVTDVAEGKHTGMDVRVIYRRDRYLRGGDHIPFLRQGYAAARFTEPNEDYAHQHQDVRTEGGQQIGDLPEFCDFDYIARVTRVNGATLWSLATGPGTPKNVRVRTDRLTNDTDLVWDRGSDADLGGYEVLLRETTSPDWTNVVPVGNVTEVRLDTSKDNVFVGVRAVDTDGHRSPVAFPTPLR